MERYAVAIIFAPGMSKTQCEEIVDRINREQKDGRNVVDFKASVEKFDPHIGYPVLYTP